jgi:hypothetical protein
MFFQDITAPILVFLCIVFEALPSTLAFVSAMLYPQFPSKLWGKVLEFLWYEDLESLVLASMFFQAYVFPSVARVNFRTTNALVREVEVVRLFRRCRVTVVYLSDFFSAALISGSDDLATFALPPLYPDASRVICSICAYQHVLAPGSLSRVLLGLSWNFVMTTNVMTGIDSLLPDHSRQLRQSVVTSSDLFLWPVDFTDELPDITYLPESTKFHFFLLQLMAAYETSLLSRSITFEGIPFWHAIPNRCNPPCVICVGVCSFFPLNQITEMGVCNQPGFFPHNFNSLCSIEYLKLLRLRPDGIVYLYSNRDDLL